MSKKVEKMVERAVTVAANNSHEYEIILPQNNDFKNQYPPSKGSV